jgi:16S rRNA (cytidine1402-2'-O)-methyltransferase
LVSALAGLFILLEYRNQVGIGENPLLQTALTKSSVILKTNESGRQGQGGVAREQKQKSKAAPGLYVVATPIGNSRDITIRALDLLAQADIVACEDSRVTARLFNMHGITAKLLPYHDHNAPKVRPQLIERLKNGEIVALVSDAGTPLISDPGYKLVGEARAEGIMVTALPGPSALLAALASSGLPTDAFLFAGFLPSKDGARRRKITEYSGLRATLVFYEGASRLTKTLTALADILGSRVGVVARELTKLYEEIRQDDLAALAAHYQNAGPPKGEIVILVAPPADVDQRFDDEKINRLLRRLLADHSLKDAVRLATAESGWRRRDVYDRALQLESMSHE